MISSVPSGPEEITATWLTEALHEAGYLSDGHVERVSVERLDPTRSVFGTLIRLHMEYSPGSRKLPRTIVAKLPSSNPISAKRLRRNGGARAEVCFYQQISQSIGLRVPQCYFSLFDEASGRFLLLLEDLSVYRFLSAKDTLTENEIAAVAKSLAASHAAWWENPRLTGLDWLRPFDLASQGPGFLAGWKLVKERFGRGASGLEALGEQIMCTVTKAEERLASPPCTLLHMDVRQDNLFFAGSDEDPVPIFIDWQNVRHGRGVLSLGSLLAFLPQRDRVEDKALALYGSELERSGVQNYPFNELMRDYRLALLRRFFTTTCALGALGPDSPQGTAVVALLSRFKISALEGVVDEIAHKP